MQPAPLPAPVQAYASDFSDRFGDILIALAKLVAWRFLRNPRLVLAIVPLCNRLHRLARRCKCLMVHVAAGRLPKRHAPSSAVPAAPTAPVPPAPEPAAPQPATPSPAVPALPTRHGWLVRELGTEAACYGSQFQALLAEPAAVELLRCAPTVRRLVNPLLRMLGIAPFAPRERPVRVVPPPPPPPPPAPRPQFPPPPDDDTTPHCSGFPWHVLLGVPEYPT